MLAEFLLAAWLIGHHFTESCSWSANLGSHNGIVRLSDENVGCANSVDSMVDTRRIILVTGQIVVSFDIPSTVLTGYVTYNFMNFYAVVNGVSIPVHVFLRDDV